MYIQLDPVSDTSRQERREAAIPRAIARSCIASKVRLLGRAVTGIYDEALRDHGLKVSQMNLLAAVSMLGRARPGQLGALLCMEKSTLSRNVDRMAARGWLETQPDEDGRSHRLAVTQEGRRVLREAHPAWKRAQRRVRRLLGGKDLAAVSRLAARLRRRQAAAG